ncbi:biosynthetic-type acetolactate synthase large subunit [Alicyclobacillus tolerans]|uniref:Acetolactate synthase n=1 Tax=Alicyclobacillus tolerans TaxID=90970 RepID=A0ABT9LXP4_9BACL|nr:biosynthetic-type acetolactate synthase large subunit [Alicyclobacillus tengchongensis]MDP9729028.1 acetolactate synthase-1/2/3 large subunit [Alicyclobacillus tengchongensis]
MDKFAVDGSSAKVASSCMMSGAQILVESLRRENVDLMFGYPGGAVLPLYDALYQCGIRHVLTRHEQGAIHMAEGYARVTGRPGVVIATSGPGATNLVTGLADAMMDSLPIVAITGQVSTEVIGTDAFQETSIIGISTPITKHNYQVRHVDELSQVIRESFHIASTGRPGPVLIDIPKNVAVSLGRLDDGGPLSLPGYQPNLEPNLLQLKRIIEGLVEAERPLLLVGAGVLHAKAHRELLQFAEVYQLPVVSTLLGLGAFPGTHPQFLGMAGMHGSYAANQALYETDFLINIGSRFDDRLTGNVRHFAPNATIVHIDIDPAEIGKNIRTHIPVVADAKRALMGLLRMGQEVKDFAQWKERVYGNKREFPFWYVPEADIIKPQAVLQQLYKLTDGDAIVVTDVGQHQMWAAQFYTFQNPDCWVTSGGLGTMGFGLPAAIGAQFGKPDKTVLAVLGDAGFQMTLQELSVVVEAKLPIKMMIVNNGSLGMVRQWQELFYNERYSESLLVSQPDYVKLADAYGIPAYRVEKASELSRVLLAAVEEPGPVLVDCRVAALENVYPMIAPGKGLHEMVGVVPL